LEKVAQAIAACFVFLFLVAGCSAQNIYSVPGFLGGINRAYDGTNLQPDQAWDLENLVFKPNALECRQGFSYWDSVAFNTSEEIDQILVYHPRCDEFCSIKRMMVATNGHIYAYISDAKPDAITWQNYALQFDGDSLQVSSGNLGEDFYGEDWLYTKLGYLDSMDVNGTMYSVNYLPGSDTLIRMVN